jgi:hypothetical protein
MRKLKAEKVKPRAGESAQGFGVTPQPSKLVEIHMGNRSTPAPNSAIRQRQAAIILSEIHLLAMCIERFGVMLVGAPDDARDTAALHAGIKRLAGEIGYMSDVASKLCGGSTCHGADATKWLLPPVFHSVADSGDQQ